MNVQPSATRIVDVRGLDPEARTALLKRFDAELFRPAFPDDDIREDPQVWLDLMASDPGSPMPVVTPLIAMGVGEKILGGIVIEYYRAAKAAFLTYIVIAPDARRKGLGAELALAAVEAVRVLNGGTVPPVFAEAERPEDADDAEETLHARARLEILSRMGAVRAALDYVQPPLAPGLGYRRLHLLAAKPTLADSASAPSAQVRAFLEELYRALGHDPATDPEFAKMAKRLAQSPSVSFGPLAKPDTGKNDDAAEPGATHVYRESPALAGIASFSIAYIFELRIDRPKRAGPMRAFRLDAIHRALDPDDPERAKTRKPAEQTAAHAAFEALLEPLESYHDDVTSGPPGRGGRPLVFGAEGPEDVSSSRTVDLVRPARWRYAAEGRRVELRAPEDEAARTVALEFRDTFCAFESGRLFYMISLQPAAGTTIDEYAIIQLQKLAHPTSSTELLREQMRFRWAGGAHTLMALIHARLAALGASKDAAPNGLRDVVKKEILEKGETIAPLDWTRLRGMVIGLEDQAVFEAVKATQDTSDVIATCGGCVLVAEPQDAVAGAPPPPHLDEAMPEPGRRALALAGVLQSVPDFPFQDGPEIWDSTRRIHGDGETYAIFSHPHFVVEVSTDWRSLRDARACLAHCPYLLLTWLVAAHDEIIVTEMEDQLGDLIYGWSETEDHRAEPLAGLRKTLKTISRQLLPGPSRSLRRSLELRLELFRRLTVNRSRYIFRYETEASVLAAMSEARGAAARFDRALDLLDRYESIVEDIQGLGQMESDRRLNVILGLVALIGVISVFAEWNSTGWWPFRAGDPTPVFLMVVGGVASLGLLWLLIDRLRR
jgi:GNAT superfamily N-acetyltransferase